MKELLAPFLFISIFISLQLSAQEMPTVVQFKYSPWGQINADEDRFGFNDDKFGKYDLEFKRNAALRIIYTPLYISIQQSITNLDDPIPDAKVETLSIGLAGINFDEFAYSSGLYIMGGLGVGAGRFIFKNSELNDWEAFGEGNAEIGLRIQEHWLLGLGVDYQLFGEPGETKAHFWNIYFGTGFIF